MDRDGVLPLDRDGVLPLDRDEEERSCFRGHKQDLSFCLDTVGLNKAVNKVIVYEISLRIEFN